MRIIVIARQERKTAKLDKEKSLAMRKNGHGKTKDISLKKQVSGQPERPWGRGRYR